MVPLLCHLCFLVAAFLFVAVPDHIRLLEVPVLHPGLSERSVEVMEKKSESGAVAPYLSSILEKP